MGCFIYFRSRTQTDRVYQEIVCVILTVRRSLLEVDVCLYLVSECIIINVKLLIHAFVYEAVKRSFFDECRLRRIGH